MLTAQIRGKCDSELSRGVPGRYLLIGVNRQGSVNTFQANTATFANLTWDLNRWTASYCFKLQIIAVSLK